jgi:hypothetical protein
MNIMNLSALRSIAFTIYKPFSPRVSVGEVEGNAMKFMEKLNQANEAIRVKLVSRAEFQRLNKLCSPVLGADYVIRRSNGTLEVWSFLGFDSSTDRFIMGQPG